MARQRRYIKNRKVAQYGGYGLILAGSAMLYDAYENRGRRRPFISKFVPGA